LQAKTILINYDQIEVRNKINLIFLINKLISLTELIFWLFGGRSFGAIMTLYEPKELNTQNSYAVLTIIHCCGIVECASFLIFSKF
jgi:hypothetical protein